MGATYVVVVESAPSLRADASGCVQTQVATCRRRRVRADGGSHRCVPRLSLHPPG